MTDNAEPKATEPNRAGTRLALPTGATRREPAAAPNATTNEFHARHEGILLPETMRAKRGLLLGDGSLGTLIASFLVRAGIGALEHYDNQVVEIPNLSRTLFRERDVSRPKVEALNDILRDIRKDIVVDGHNTDIHAMPDDKLIAAIKRADIVIVATDHPQTQARAAALSYWRKPAVLPGVYERGTGGEVVFTLPDQSACWHCVFNGIRTDEQPNRGEVDYGVPTGQLLAVPALGADIATIAVAAARMAIALIHQGTAVELARMIDAERNILFLGNTIDWAFTDYSENFWARTTRRPDCPVCAPDNAP